MPRLVSSLPTADVRRGLLVSLLLGARVDTTLGVVERPACFVADDDAPDGRRLAPTRVDADGRETDVVVGEVTGIAAAASRGSFPIVVEFPGGARAIVEADALEVVADAPPAAPDLDAARAERDRTAATDALSAAEQTATDTAAAIEAVRRDLDNRNDSIADMRDSIADLRRALESIEAASAERARVLSADPDARFVTRADVRELLAAKRVAPPVAPGPDDFGGEDPPHGG